ncbi:MAG TPA: hypothetical protein VFU48_05535 [Nitrospira sp.]|nr:hypothetical protein [Nitrospira sp.]
MRNLIKPLSTHSAAAVAAAALAALSGIGATANKVSKVQVIYVRNVSSYVTDAEVRNALPAFQEATSGDFAPIWHVDAKLVFIGRRTAPVGSETITLIDKGTVKNALAFPELVNGVPDSIIYTAVSKFYGYSWTVGFTHELWEMLADPGLVRTMQDQTGTIWANEVADPVEADADGYTRPGLDGKPVLISDFVTEKWFGALDAGPYDFCNHIQSPLVIDKGGYAQWWDGSTWHVIQNFEKGSPEAKGFHW